MKNSGNKIMEPPAEPSCQESNTGSAQAAGTVIKNRYPATCREFISDISPSRVYNMSQLNANFTDKYFLTLSLEVPLYPFPHHGERCDSLIKYKTSSTPQ